MAKLVAKLDNRSTELIKRKIKALRAPLTRPVATKLGLQIIRQMKSSISKGKSTIKGRGAFPPYRGSYRKNIQKRGFISVNRKKVTKKLSPVNLKLTGDFLKALKFKIVTARIGSGITIGFFKPEEILKEEGHRKQKNKQAKRPVIPNQREQFSTTIQRIYLKVLNRQIRKIAKRE